MWIGNDIVDLSLNQKHHPRFVRRIFSDHDLERYNRGGAQSQDLWLAWAAKEAAYKLEKQRDAAIYFSPAEFSVDLSEAKVNWRGRVHSFGCVASTDYVHVWVHSGSGRVETKVAPASAVTTGLSARNLSADVRILAASVVSSLFGIRVDEVVVDTDQHRIPFAVRRDSKGVTRLPCAISLSHDGGFVAVAVAAAGAEGIAGPAAGSGGIAVAATGSKGTVLVSE